MAMEAVGRTRRAECEAETRTGAHPHLQRPTSAGPWSPWLPSGPSEWTGGLLQRLTPKWSYLSDNDLVYSLLWPGPNFQRGVWTTHRPGCWFADHTTRLSPRNTHLSPPKGQIPHSCFIDSSGCSLSCLSNCKQVARAIPGCRLLLRQADKSIIDHISQ